VAKVRNGDHNWRKGMNWGRLYGSAFRHMLGWWGSERLDDESGLPHLAHAIANLMMLIECEAVRHGLDDRYRKNAWWLKDDAFEQKYGASGTDKTRGGQG